MAGDPEIDAMSAVAGALAPLDDDAQGRVLEWAAKRYGVALISSGNGGRPQFHGGDGSEDGHDEVDRADVKRDGPVFEHFADLYDAANPQNEEDRVLVGAYWFQVLQEEGTFKGGPVNEALRNMGHAVNNVTRTCDRLQVRQPAVVRQMAKSGKSKQHRKTYKLTNPGIKAVEAMLE